MDNSNLDIVTTTSAPPAIKPAAVSFFDLFSIGIGPSSSHTVGPMRALHHFLSNRSIKLCQATRISVELLGSLALTGRGHGTDNAVILGLMGKQPETINPNSIPQLLGQVHKNHTVQPTPTVSIPFDPQRDIIFNFKQQNLKHPNTLKITAYTNDNIIAQATYYSIGGGFIECEGEIMVSNCMPHDSVPHPFNSAEDLLQRCIKHKCSIADIQYANELSWRNDQEINEQINTITNTMSNCIKRGCQTQGVLPGGIKVQRRAYALYQQLQNVAPLSPTHPQRTNWLNVYAMAVNEENAAGGQVVTAPTNGAAGIIPAVIEYSRKAYTNIAATHDRDFLLTATAIGSLYKQNASISGAEVGCQGEVGVACSMAAAGLAAALGGTPLQVENAAEIAMEHNLGLTCDPVAGLVQIPCIERNAMGAVKAVNAAELALAEEGSNRVSLDTVIKTMMQIGKNMSSIYKETAQGGLASTVNVPEC